MKHNTVTWISLPLYKPFRLNLLLQVSSSFSLFGIALLFCFSLFFWKYDFSKDFHNTV